MPLLRSSGGAANIFCYKHAVPPGLINSMGNGAVG